MVMEFTSYVDEWRGWLGLFGEFIIHGLKVESMPVHMDLPEGIRIAFLYTWDDAITIPYLQYFDVDFTTYRYHFWMGRYQIWWILHPSSLPV